MLEHVGVNFYNVYFRRCAESSQMTGDAAALYRTFHRCRCHQPLDHQIHLSRRLHPAVSEVTPALERAGVLICDIEIPRLHYAETLKAWRERFMAQREEAVRLYDERFARMWELYLACSEMAFRKQNLMVMQIQLTKRQGIVPTTCAQGAEGATAAADCRAGSEFGPAS
jgi:cyclopropane-fatty-acyl-phospholipid synthase